MCLSCSKRNCHVQLSGDCLKDMENEHLKKILNECSIVKPLHIIKKEQDRFALIHFESELEASTFYHVYCIQKILICKRLEGIRVNPSLINNKPIIYSSFQVQPRLSSSSKLMCRCSTALDTNTTNNSSINPNNNLTPTTSPSNRSADTLVASITGTNPTNINLNVTANADDNLSVISSENVDDWNEDIERAKTKIKNQIKRKLQEIEILRKKLRTLEDI